MKNTWKNAMRSIAIIAIAALIGFSMAACGDDPAAGGGEQKKITVNGYTPPGGGRITIVIFASYEDFINEIMYGSSEFITASAYGTVSGNSVTFPLVTDTAMTPFTGTGAYYLLFDYYEDEEDGFEEFVLRRYLYTNGQTLEALHITSPTDLNKAPMFTISGETSTIDSAKFKEVTDIWWSREYDDDDDGDDDGDDIDPFAATWIGPDVKIVAADGEWKEYQIPEGTETIRGTYTYSSNIVTAIAVEVNTAMFGGADEWVYYEDMDETYKGNMGGTDTFILTITDNTFSIEGQDQIFIVAPDLNDSWTRSVSTEEGDFTVNIVISGNALTIKMNGNDSQKGTFAFSSEKIYISITHDWRNGAWEPVDREEEKVTFKYVLNGDTFTLSNGLVDGEEPTEEKGRMMPYLEGEWTRSN